MSALRSFDDETFYVRFENEISFECLNLTAMRSLSELFLCLVGYLDYIHFADTPVDLELV